MKLYSVSQIARKLNTSEFCIYEAIKRGELKKVENLGRSIRVTPNSLKEYEETLIPFKEIEIINIDNTNNTNQLKIFDSIDFIGTHLGTVRKIKKTNEFIAVDVAKVLNIRDSHSITKHIDSTLGYYRTASKDEANSLGMSCTISGLTVINLNGIKMYLIKNTKNIDCAKFIKELENNIDTISETVEEVKTEEIEKSVTELDSNDKIILKKKKDEKKKKDLLMFIWTLL